MNFYVYIIYNVKHDKFYIGQTYSLQRRIFEHKNGLANHTSRYDGEWLFLHWEKFATRAGAMAKEKFFKSQKNKKFLKEYIKMARQ